MAKKNQPNPPKCYIDACVYLSYIEETADRIAEIDDLFSECERFDREGITCHLSIAEVAFAKWEKEQQALDRETEEKIDSLWHPNSPFRMAEVSEFTVRDARDLMRGVVNDGLSLKAHDAIHFAVAKAVGVLEFFTYDTQLFKFDKRWGFRVLTPYVKPGQLFARPPRPQKTETAKDAEQ